MLVHHPNVGGLCLADGAVCRGRPAICRCLPQFDLSVGDAGPVLLIRGGRRGHSQSADEQERSRPRPEHDVTSLGANCPFPPWSICWLRNSSREPTFPEARRTDAPVRIVLPFQSSRKHRAAIPPVERWLRGAERYPLARANAHHHTPSSSRGILGNPSETPTERLHPAVWPIALCGGDDIEVNAARKELSSLCGKRTVRASKLTPSPAEWRTTHGRSHQD